MEIGGWFVGWVVAVFIGQFVGVGEQGEPPDPRLAQVGVAVGVEPAGLVEELIEGPASLQAAFDGGHQRGPPGAVFKLMGGVAESLSLIHI